jgi:hypothetical protein
MGLGASPIVTEREYWEAVQDGCAALRVNVASITVDELASFKKEFAQCVAFQTGTVHANTLEAKLAAAVAFTTDVFNARRSSKLGLEPATPVLPLPMPPPPAVPKTEGQDFERLFHGGLCRLQRLKQRLESGLLQEAEEHDIRKHVARGVLLYIDLYGITPF